LVERRSCVCVDMQPHANWLTCRSCVCLLKCRTPVCAQRRVPQACRSRSAVVCISRKAVVCVVMQTHLCGGRHIDT
jgi:hypothetical protein